MAARSISDLPGPRRLPLIGNAHQVRPDTLQWRKRAAEYVIEPVELPGLLDSLDIRSFFDHTDDALVARGAGAEQARVAVRDVIADRALADFFLSFADGIGKRERLSAVHAQKIKCESLRRFLPDAGQALQLVDQSRDGRSKIRHANALSQSRVRFRQT